MNCLRHSDSPRRTAPLILTPGCEKCDDIEFKSILRDVHRQCVALWTRGRLRVDDVIEDLRSVAVEITILPWMADRSSTLDIINRVIRKLEAA